MIHASDTLFEHCSLEEAAHIKHPLDGKNIVKAQEQISPRSMETLLVEQQPTCHTHTTRPASSQRQDYSRESAPSPASATNKTEATDVDAARGAGDLVVDEVVEVPFESGPGGVVVRRFEFESGWSQ